MYKDIHDNRDNNSLAEFIIKYEYNYTYIAIEI